MLSSAQVAGIVHLVASGVAGMSDKSVNVVDQDGNLLTAASQSTSGIEPSQLAYRNAVEQQYRRQIESILSPLVGSNGVRVAVSADLDFGKTETSSVIYGQGHPLSHQAQTQNSTGNASLPAGVPGALTNQPPGGVAAPFTVGSASQPLTPQQFTQLAPALRSLAPTASSSSATTNYDVDKTISHTQQPVGSVRRISVAVLINDRPPTAKGASAKPQPMSSQQLAQIRQLVQDAIGFDAKRGDQVSVVSMPFGGSSEAQQAALPLWRSPAIWDSVREAIPYLLALIFGLLIYRAVRRLATPSARDEEEEDEAEERGEAGRGAGAASGELAPEVVHLSNTFENDAAVSRELARQDPRRAAQVVKEWLADGQ